MANEWINFVKKVAAQKGIPYRDALKVASASYKGRAIKGAPHVKKVASEKGRKTYTRKTTPMKKIRGKKMYRQMEGAGFVDSLVSFIRKSGELIENLELVQDLINLFYVFMDENSNTDDMIRAGKPVFRQFCTNGLKMLLTSQGIVDPYVLGLVDILIPVLADKVYDYIVKKIQGGANGIENIDVAQLTEQLFRELNNEIEMLKQEESVIDE